MSASNEQFLRTLQERHEIVKNALNAAICGAPAGTIDENHKFAIDFLAACENLNIVLAPQDKPAWMSGALSQANNFSKNKSGGPQMEFFKWLHENGPIISQQITPQRDGEINFDKMYGDIRDVQGIPTLFDRMVDLLGKIIALDVIESRTVSSALEKLRVTLKSNRKGSQGAIFASMNYTKLVWLILKGYGSTLIGPVFDALEETYKEAEEKVELVNQEFRAQSLVPLIDEKGMRRLCNDGWLKSEDVLDQIAGFIEVKDSVLKLENDSVDQDLE